MKKFRPSKLLIFSLSIATFVCALIVQKADAQSSTQYNRSVQEMMARRHGASVKSFFGLGKSKAEKQRAQQISSRNIVGPREAYTPPKTSRMITRKDYDKSMRKRSKNNEYAYASAGSGSSLLSSWFDVSDKDGSIFPGGPCKNCHASGPLIDTGSCERCYEGGALIDTGPCHKCKEPKEVKEPMPVMEPVCPVCEQPQLINYAITYNDYVVQAMARDCCAMAPIFLEHVDFNLSEDDASVKNKMGNYHFRIFGCRRYDKEAVLNRGRLMEKDMRFTKIFEETTGDCYNIVKMPEDICLETTPKPMPEYVLTAEISDVFMNICDGYDYKNAKASDKRSGSAEMTVRWKLSNPTKTKIVWEGETTGYADLNVGKDNGEIALIEAAFEDAVSNLQTARGFERQLSVRLTPEELTAEREALIDEERALNPAKCALAKPLYDAKQCEITREDADITECPAFQEQIVLPPCAIIEDGDASAQNEFVEGCVVEDSGISSDGTVAPVAIVENGDVSAENVFLDNCIDETGNIVENGNCTVVDDTWVDTEVKAFDSLCITTRAPYDVLTPENLYKVRASVVELSNVSGKKGAGLIVSDSFIITSANLIDNQYNTYKIRTINGKELSGRAVRVNPSKNTALIMLDTPTEYTPLSLNTELPVTGQNGFMTLGLLDVEAFDNGSENYIDNSGKILGYRYSDEKGSEIIVDTHVQDLTIGSVLIDGHGTINGFAHTGQKTDSGKDLFLPTETALRSLGLTICDCVWEKPSKFEQTVYKPVTQLIHTVQKTPEEMKKAERK